MQAYELVKNMCLEKILCSIFVCAIFPKRTFLAFAHAYFFCRQVEIQGHLSSGYGLFYLS